MSRDPFASAPIRLPKMLRRREAERRRVDAFLAAIRRSADCCDACTPAPAPRRPAVVGVELVDTPRGPVWQLDEASRARFVSRRTDTAALPRIVARASAPLR